MTLDEIFFHSTTYNPCNSCIHNFCVSLDINILMGSKNMKGHPVHMQNFEETKQRVKTAYQPLLECIFNPNRFLVPFDFNKQVQIPTNLPPIKINAGNGLATNRTNAPFRPHGIHPLTPAVQSRPVRTHFNLPLNSAMPTTRGSGPWSRCSRRRASLPLSLQSPLFY